MSESLDRRETIASCTPLTGNEHAVETLDRLPGLARAIEVWERDLSSCDQEESEDASALFHIPSSSALDGLDAEDVRWCGPDPIDEWARERMDDLPDGYLNTGW